MSALTPRSHTFRPSRMRGAAIALLRRDLGSRWGLGRDVTLGELGALLRLAPGNAWATVGDWESGRREPSGPVMVALEMMEAGADPGHLADVLRPTGARTSPRGPYTDDQARR